MKKKFLSSHSAFFLALVIGLALAVGASVWATTIGTNIAGTGTLSITGATTLNGAVTIGDAAGDAFTINAATSTIASASATAFGIATSSANIAFLRFDTSGYRLGISTTSPGATLSVGGAGNIYGLGTLNMDGNVVLGDAAGDTLIINGNSTTFANAGTTTIPSASAVSWSIATSSADIPFLRFNTSTWRLGIGTTTPGATLSVGGAGNIYAEGGISATGATTTVLSVSSMASTTNLRVSKNFYVGLNGSAVASVIHGFCAFGPIISSQTILATSTGSVACQSEVPTGLAAGDKVWLTASTTAMGGNSNFAVSYTGIASTTATRINALVHNGTGTDWTVTTSTWQYLIVK